MLENKKSVTNKQLSLLLDEVEKNPTLSHEKILSGTERIHDAKWEKLVEKLNAVPNGAKRSIARWKTVLSNWKLTLKKQADSNENVDNPEVVDEMGKRLLRLVEEEELVRNVEVDLFLDFTDFSNPTEETENQEILQGPQLRILNRRSRLARISLGRGPYMNSQRTMNSLNTIYDNNVDRDNSPERKIMQMQLDRLHCVSQQLESHIQDVQNRIQAIKDMWHHECIEE
ncbi:unnamed protein product [Arctia plantaginis]|uniref:Regulatory protein zeste n=1 Tax=Arctia plantaginis TaxID=874455 RepID=A0A8S0ZZ30_ARCPL|nr:unnamed protein product [Arctia plantaginis]